MAKLRLYKAESNKCKYKIYLSNDFDREFYKNVRITQRNYGSETNNVR